MDNLFINDDLPHHMAVLGHLSRPTAQDPYRYQQGFNNHHASEAFAGALPHAGTNLPQKHPYGLYAEHLNGTAFISSRDSVSNVSTTFLQGLRTIAGHGDPTLRTGLAVHQYAFTADMTRQALTSHDGEMLLVPQRGTLDLQTELGYLRVAPGSIAVIPPGVRFSVALASFPAPAGGTAGYVLEIFGAHFRLPELGPLGGNALAHVRDFQYPVASFDLDFDRPPNLNSPGPFERDWEIVVKVAGRFHAYTQPHTPYDVVAWHGRYAPYKYDLARFSHLTANSDQLDPTAYCVLTAPSKHPGVSLVDFCVFGEKWAVARDTLRIPYHHRTMATELMGIIKGKYGGSVRRLEAGGLSFEQGYMGHGETYECWRDQSERLLETEFVGKDCLSFMFHVPGQVALTKYATERHPDIRLDDTTLWDNLRAPFIDKLGEASRALEKMRISNEAAIQAELTALAFEVMANKRRLSSVCVTDDEWTERRELPERPLQ
ncbi:hypothetical protein N0V93_008949 [Gnomoniopsis smithogilvyi]|uniref:homogentisate 1,2-dioxygenase n=1 Tax=Gnomoniopsis smithogilvyi TaxID=1191159 RepID=A0A9W8YJ22_9PEZI|nr:hypothetical protein N0V93_008949 [Gnomoniopsis smithogilvyi]